MAITRIQLRRDLAATWTSVNPVLAQGEEGWERDTGKRKVGDGATAWTALPYDDAEVGALEARTESLESTHVIADAVTGADTAALAAKIAATPPGGVLTLRAAASYVISDALAVAAPITIRLNGASIRQITWRKPVFDCGVTDDVTIEGPGRLYSTEVRTNGATSFRGDDEDRYGAGVWTAGNRTTVRKLRVDGLDSGVHATNWTTGITHTGTPTGLVVDDLVVSNVDFGVLCVSQDGPHIENVRGSYVRSTGSPDPAHLVYVIGTSTDKVMDLTGGNWRAVDSAADAAYQLRQVDGAALGALMARNCGGLLNYDALKNVTIDRLVGVNDQKADENGSVQAIDATSELVRIRSLVLRKAVAGRAVWIAGTDVVVDDATVETNRPLTNGNENIKIQGTRSGIRRLVHRNAASATVGGEGVLITAGSDGCFATDLDLTGVRNGVVVQATATNARLLYDPALIVPEATFARVSNSGTGTRQTIVQAGDTAWREIGAAGEPAFANAWVNFGAGYNTAAYRVDNDGYVHLKGLIKLGAIGAAAFTLPAGFRPALIRMAATISNGAVGRLDVEADGDVVPVSGSNVYVSLEGIVFKPA